MMQVKERGAANGFVLAARPSDRSRWLLAAVLVTYLAVTLAYGVVNPIFEAPDEHMHFFTMQAVAETGQLPVVTAGDAYDEWMGQEAAQPPLYYLLGSLVLSPFDLSGSSDALFPNEFTAMGDASSLNNINRFVHGPEESFPWQGYALPAHVLRAISTFVGLGTLLFIYASGRLIWPGHPYRALLAAALVAYLPQYNFLHASITNDVLIVFFVSAALYQLIRLWTREVSFLRLLLLGITVGLAALSKNAGIVLLLYTGGVLFLMAIRGNVNSRLPGTGMEAGSGRPSLSGVRLILAAVLLVLVPTLLLAGWLWARNWLLYGDFTATNQFINIAGGARDYTLLQVLGESRGLWLSLFAVFGWFNLRAPNWVYWFWNGLVLLALGGAIVHALRLWRSRQHHRGLPANTGLIDWLSSDWMLPLLLAGWVALVYASLVRFMLETEAAQGRLLFPALLPLALGLAFGLTAVRALRRISIIWAPLALAITVYCLFFIIRPAYALPETVAVLPQDVLRLDAQLGPGLSLAGAEVQTQTAEAGDKVWMTLYWRALTEITEPPEFAVTIFGRNLTEIGKHHSYHGRGMFPANLWPQGALIVDHFAVDLAQEIETPVLGQVRVNVIDGDGDALAGEVKVEPHKWPESDAAELARIGETISLLSAEVSPHTLRAGETIGVDVRWRVAQPPLAELTTLVHVGPADQQPLAVGDRPPLGSDYPTRVWDTGEVIDDSYTVTLPAHLSAGNYPVWIGMYDSDTITRWPVTVQGEVQPFNIYLAGWVEVVE